MTTNVDARLLKQTKFPPEFSRKVDMTKVNVEVMKKWIAGKISEILGNEDDVVIELCFNLLEGTRFPDIKFLQIQLTGFLDTDTPKFCKELWSLCLSAQENPQGVPKELLEAKKLELIQEKIDAEKAAEESRLQKEQERARERELEETRKRERFERSRGGRRGGDRGGRAFDRRTYRDSWSPPPRRRSRERYNKAAPRARREPDSYVPSSRPHRGRRRRSSKSPSRSPSRSISRSRSSSSRSPPPRRARYEGRDRPRDRRRRSVDISVSPDRRRNNRRRSSPDYGDRQRSITRSDSSRSPTPRRDRRRQRSVSSRSLSRSPTYRSRHTRTRREFLVRRSRSRSLDDDSRSRSRTPEKRNGQRRGISPYKNDSRSTRRDSSADVVKGRRTRDDRRLSRSRSRTTSGSRSPSRSRSPRRGGRKRHRSIERYAPAARRRRNTSSTSVPTEKRHRINDEKEKEHVSKRPSSSADDPKLNSNDHEMKDAAASEVGD